MRLLIIGANGFIGNAAIQYFSECYEIYGCDISAHSSLRTNHFWQIDSLNPDFNSIFRNTSFDYCLNASGAANVGFSFTDPLSDFRLNVGNVAAMLDSIRQFNPECRFLNISSAAVYGNPNYLPIDEQHAIAPLSPYGWHKYQSELLCREHASLYKQATRSIRVFSAYGPGLRKQLFWDMHQKLLRRKAVYLYGTGNESRDFVYIADLLQAIELVFLHASFDGGVINVANGEEITIRRAAETFYQCCKPGQSIRFSGEERTGDPVNWRAEVALLKALGYKRCYTFEQGIEQYVKWLQDTK
jgi:dTDP-glucose 4,6-dehydratase/UDP-glucose 4-epimerase